MTEKELLLTALLNCKRSDLYSQDFHLDKNQEEKLSSMLRRRLNGEPVQYITGFTEFMGFCFKVDRRALVPRPETEILVEKTLDLIKDKFGNKRINLLDLGTGSGNIAVSLAKLSRTLQVFASDISQKALEVARENARINEVVHRINFLKSDLFENCFKHKFDIIISNPPYLTSEELDSSAIELNYEPRISLEAGNDGLLFYRKIIKQAPRYLKKNGFLIFEIGYNQLEKIKTIAEDAREFIIEKTFRDYNGFERIIFLRKNN
ncbi:MAG: peptide chain release factor N(5)-glutamine methyltransferase [Candidatus Omnitrophica bacterium]|nr:peptide chain release factor N(5)-glutamine methyltransferase [Candidatus Omnitrophota bacterium]